MKKKPTDTCVKCGCARRRHRSARSGIDRTRCRNCQCLGFREIGLGQLHHDAEGKSYTVGDYQKAARDGDPRTAPPAPPPVPTCPLAPHIPLASVGVIGAYLVMPPAIGATNRAPSLLLISRLNPDTTTESAAKTLGGGGFILACYDITRTAIVGEATIMLPGERSERVMGMIDREKQARVDNLKAASDKQATETAFSTQLHTDEEELVRLLAGIHDFVTHTRFEVASVTDAQGVAFQKALTDSERGIALLVKRLKARSGAESWWASSAWITAGLGMAAMVYYALAKPFGTDVPKPTAAGVGVGKAP